MIGIIIYLALSALVAVLVGTNRQIGQGWTLFFCLTFSVLIGGLIALASPKKAENKPQKKSSNPLVILFAILGLIIMFAFIFVIQNPETTQTQAIALALSIFGFFGAAIYAKDQTLIDMG